MSDNVLKELEIPEEHILEPEIMGQPQSALDRLMSLFKRGVLTLLLLAAGLVLCAVGGFLTLSIIGATIGIPILIFGLVVLAGSILFIINGATPRLIAYRGPRP